MNEWQHERLKYGCEQNGQHKSGTDDDERSDDDGDRSDDGDDERSDTADNERDNGGDEEEEEEETCIRTAAQWQKAQGKGGRGDGGGRKFKTYQSPVIL